MELNTEGFYKKPRVLAGFKFTNIDTLEFEYTTTPDGKRGVLPSYPKGKPHA